MQTPTFFRARFVNNLAALLLFTTVACAQQPTPTPSGIEEKKAAIIERIQKIKEDRAKLEEQARAEESKSTSWIPSGFTRSKH